MKITNIEAIVLRLPKYRDEADGTQDDLLVRVETDEGIVGWGEVDSSPAVAKAVIDTPASHSVCHGLRELLLGTDPLLIEQAWRQMFAATRYYGRFGPVLHAMSGVDLALWDIAGKVHGQPVHKLLGAAWRTRVKAYASALMPHRPEQAESAAAEYRRLGFQAMKFGWGPIGKSPALDHELFRAVRQGAGPDCEIMIDAGQTYTLRQAIAAAEWLAEIDASWLEEPLDPDDLDGYARLTSCSPVPIATGESESGIAVYRRLITETRVDIVQPDLSHAGGITAGRQIASIAEANGCACIPHAFKSNLLVAATLQFCAAIESARLLEYSMSDSSIRRNLTRERLPLVDGHVEVPRGPGLGVEINDDLLDELAAPNRLAVSVPDC